RRPRRGGARRGTADPVRPAVFLDRDGTMIEDVGYLDAIARVAFYPWTIDSIRALNRAGLAVVVVTNQSGVARVDAYYYCPHHPRGTVAPFARDCDCRKPARGLIDRAAADLGLDPAR